MKDIMYKIKSYLLYFKSFLILPDTDEVEDSIET